MQLTSMLEEYYAYSAKVAQEEVEANWESKGPQRLASVAGQFTIT